MEHNKQLIMKLLKPMLGFVAIVLAFEIILFQLLAHGILSFDLKEDKDGNMKVTEVNIRHMAYAGVMAHVGFDLIEDTIRIMEDGNCDNVERAQYYHYEKPYIFLRDVDVEPIILESEEIFDDPAHKFEL